VAVHVILFVRDQERSTRFYAEVFGKEPRLQVDGMTEFDLSDGMVLGLMPETGIRRLLGSALPAAAPDGAGPRSELYVEVDEPEVYLDRATAAGAELVSPCSDRDWGATAGYCLDPDGHLLAFASTISP
jgi:catechol 2,3-dioxygenase-like lactoylglutathione lyase family enzyme